MTGSLVTSTQFAQIAGSFGFTSAVLLDDRGTVIAVYPNDPRLIGTHPAQRYAHLRRALTGRTTVSSTVRSVAAHQSIVASAVPFATAYGRRVFSGGFDIGSSPIGAYMRSAASLPHSVFAIDDSTGNFATGSPNGISPSAARLFEDTGDRSGYVVTEHRVQGTPWTIDALVPANTLYRPLQHRNTLYWLILAGFALVCILALGLLYRLMRSKDAMRQLASVDPLTGALNRRALEEAYVGRSAQRARYGGSGSLLVLDLDGFKQVNDALGHAQGDELLRMVVRTLRTTLRSSDWIARIGGDEFAILLHDADAATAAHVIAKLERALAELPPLGRDGALLVRASVGYAVETELPETLTQLLARSDSAMYVRKTSPRLVEPALVS